MTREAKAVSTRGWDFAAQFLDQETADEVEGEKAWVTEIEELRSLHAQMRDEGAGEDAHHKGYARICEILEQYQEQSHLLDQHLEELVTPLLLQMCVCACATALMHGARASACACARVCTA